MVRLIAKHRTPTRAYRSRRKQQTATTQRLTTIPAALLEMTSNSLLMRKRPTSAPEMTGAYSAPRFHIRYEARRMLATVRMSQRKWAGPHLSNENGNINGNAAGGHTVSHAIS